MPKQESDPLLNPAFRPPGLMEKLREALLGATRPLDCVQIETTSFCGGRCVYCPHTAQGENWRSRHMSREVFASLWPLLRQASRAHLQGWGEPLLNPDFFDFQALAARAGCQTSTTSRGLNISADIAARLAESGMDLIAFSLVGTDGESNSARAGVPFAKVCESIKILREAIRKSARKPPLEIHFAYLMLADRMEAVAGLPELMDRLDVEMAVISTLDYLAVPDQGNLAFQPHEDKKIGKAREILEATAAKAEKYGRLVHYALPGPEPAENGCRENIGRTLYVDAEGRISPCVYLNVPAEGLGRTVFGNSLVKNPLEIWRQENFRVFRENLLAGKTPEVCLGCPKRHEH